MHPEDGSSLPMDVQLCGLLQLQVFLLVAPLQFDDCSLHCDHYVRDRAASY